MDEKLKARAIKSLEWLVEDAKWRYDTDKYNMIDGSGGGYSEQLCEAIDVLKELKGE